MVKIYSIILFLIFSTILSAQVTPGDPNSVPVEFRFIHSLASTDIGFGINGNMNNWGAIYKLHEVEPNTWKAILELTPKSYEYKFVSYIDTTSQTGVTGYFTDPLNSNFGGPFNNSMMDVTDPMIYYFLPIEGSTTAILKPTFKANFAVANKSLLDITKIEFSIDGEVIANASSYYDPATKIFTYDPPSELTTGIHTSTIKIANTDGNTAELSTSFTIASGISSAPFTFTFDSKSPNFNFQSEINKVDVKGTFNYEGLDAMTDSDGVYTVTKELMIGKPEEYTYIINGGSYINDPDNPELSIKHRTQVEKELNPRSVYSNINPASGIVYNYPQASVTIKAHLSQSDSGYEILASGIYGKYDGFIVRPTKTPSGNGYDVTVKINSPALGRHVLELFGKDDHGVNSKPSVFTFGMYPPGDGYHYIDGENDDKGTGSYTYPSGVEAGSADLREIYITTSNNLDSLNFSIKMGKISYATGLKLGIVDRLSGKYIEAPGSLELNIPDWLNDGVLISLSKTQGVLEIPNIDLAVPYIFELDSSALVNNEFKFSLPLNLLENVMGTYNKNWYMFAYTYFTGIEGSIEVEQFNGGSDAVEDPDVYDVAFFSDANIQERLLSNYRPPDQIGGARFATIGSLERGSGAVDPYTINPDLGKAPDILIYASGGDVYVKDIKVKGYANVDAGTNISVYVNGTAYNAVINSQKEFETTLPLIEGYNYLTARVTYNVNKIASSSPVIYNYLVNHIPIAKIYNTIGSTSVTMYADSSFDPYQSVMSFKWEADANNPAPVQLSSSTGVTTSFNIPVVKGEYYFNLLAINANSDTGRARTVVVVNDSSYVPQMGKWHPAWIDSAVFYCVFVRTFDASGTFNGLASRMQELKDLGITGIWLLPVHPSTGNMGPDNPGYAITDYYGILQDYGNKNDFRNLINTAHSYGIRIIMDQVIQHTSDLHPFMKDANKYKDASPYYPFYIWDANKNFQYLFTWVDLPSINYENADTRNYLINMADYWVREFNIDGYRCDVAWAVDSLRASGPAFWQRWRSELKNIKPDVFLLAEANAYWQTKLFNNKFDAAYDWDWFGRIKGLVSHTQTIEDLNRAIEEYKGSYFPEHARAFKFMENQDEQRFIDAFGVADTKVMAAHLLTAPGIPMLYAGQEVGEMTNRGNIQWSDPYGLRPYYKTLIDIRKNTPALAYGNFTRINNSTPDKVYSYLRTSGMSNTIVLLNFSTGEVSTNISVPMDKISFDSLSRFYLVDNLNQVSPPVYGIDLKNYKVIIPASGAQIYTLSYDPLSAVEKDKNIPTVFKLEQNYPNPFNPSTTIKFSLPQASRVTIRVYNALGQKVTDLIDKEISAGFHNVVWNASDMASGIYIYMIETTSLNGNKTIREAKKMILLK